MPTYLTPASTSRRSRPRASRSRASARRSPPSSASRPAARSTRRCGSRTGRSSRRSSAIRSNPDNGPFMEGAYLAHSVYGFFQNGGSLCWIVRVGNDERRRAPRAALPAATDKSRRGVPRRGARRRRATRSRSSSPRSRGAASDKDAGDATYKLVVTAGSRDRGVRGPDAQEGPHEHRDQGQRRLEADQDRGDRRVAARGPARPGDRHLHAVGAGPEARGAQADATSRATSPRRKGMGGLAAVDEVTMVCMPDVMTLAAQRRRHRAARPPGQDDRPLRERWATGWRSSTRRPDLLPQEILEWRMNTAGYDSKMAALYYPWIEVMDPLTNRPMMVPPSGHVAGVWCRTDAHARRPQGPGQRGHPRRQRPRRSRSPRPSRAASTRSASTASARSRAAASASGARARCRATPSGATSTCAGCSTSSPSRSWRARSGACSSPTTSGCGRRCGSSASNFLHARRGATARCSARRPTRRSSSSATPRPTRPRSSRPARSSARSASRPVKPAEFVIFRLSQFTGGGGAEVAE